MTNPLLKLKGKFAHSKSLGIPGPPTLSPNEIVDSSHLEERIGELKHIANSWSEISEKPVISVKYKRTIPKSRRIKRIFSQDAKHPSDSTIVGARFWGPNREWHQVVHCVTMENLYGTIAELESTLAVLKGVFNSEIDCQTLKTVSGAQGKSRYDGEMKKYGTSRTTFMQIIVDIASVKGFFVDRKAPNHHGNVIVTLYETELQLPQVLQRLGIPYMGSKVFGENSVLLYPDEYEKLKRLSPYLVSMSCDDAIAWDDARDVHDIRDDSNPEGILPRKIGSPTVEPTIGVIDTLFLKDKRRVYFSDWVEYDDDNDRTSKDEPEDDTSYMHGTCVDSIIVDGPALNPQLDDGCGNFKVRHFGVTRRGTMHISLLARELRNIVADNRDITVWNLSLGSNSEIPHYSISPLAAIIDDIQAEYNVLFVVSATNTPRNTPTEDLKIGSPADSVNALVVGSVDRADHPASYSRSGPALNFFTKPDVSYYGGDIGEPCTVWGIHGEKQDFGTSYAAPWIARKLSYLIDIKGLSREAAKALIVDAASGWNPDVKDWKKIGHGVVPVRIEDVIGSSNDEIKFVITGRTELYKTYNYQLPIPISSGKFPYNARATLCYFPSCSRNQGVDYTDSELDFRFGRLKDGTVLPINNDLQNDLRGNITEGDARRNFRKWDNVKIISETIKDRKIPKKAYNGTLWGIDITSKKRLDNKDRENLSFGIVITLKEMNGVNRIDAFSRACRANGWIVESVQPEIDWELIERMEEEVEFDEVETAP